MKHSLEVYRVRLTALGPVFIGNGSELSKKEYLFLDNQKMAGVLDMERLYRLISQKGLRRQFEAFMMDARGTTGLGDWLREYQIDKREIKACLRYTLDSGDIVIRRGSQAKRRTPVQIMECVKDPYGNPYIPGSSLKGMLRTILLSGRILEAPERFERETENLLREMRRSVDLNYVNKKQLLREESGKIEEAGFYCLNRNEKKKSDAVNDELSGMIVSDSKPLELKNLVLCQKIERHPDGTEKRLNLLRECIRPGTAMDFTITIEKNICRVRKEDILKGAERFNDAYYRCFLKAFYGIDRPVPRQVYLGGGVGFASKTFIYPLLGKQVGLDAAMQIFKVSRVPVQHKHNRDRQYGVSPHIVKCTSYRGQCVQMGRCRLDFL